MDRSISPTPVWFNEPNYTDHSFYITDHFLVLHRLDASNFKWNAPEFAWEWLDRWGISKIDVPNKALLMDLFLRVNVGIVEKINESPQNRIPSIRKFLYKCRSMELNSGVIGPRLQVINVNSFWSPFKQSFEEIKPWLTSLGGQGDKDDFYFKAASVTEIENLYGTLSGAFNHEEVVVDICFQFMGIDFALPILNIGDRSLKVKKRAKKRKMSGNGNGKKKPRIWSVETEVRKSFEKKAHEAMKALLKLPEFASVKDNPKEAKSLCRNVVTKMKI